MQPDDKIAEESSCTRRSFLRTGIAGFGGVAVAGLANQSVAQINDGHSRRRVSGTTFLEILRHPDSVEAYSAFGRTVPTGRVLLERVGNEWHGPGLQVSCSVDAQSATLSLVAPSSPVAVIHMRWRTVVRASVLVLGDAWERSYGELGWRNLIPERVLPWYFATWDGTECHGYGVKTDSNALCMWQIDPEGVSLWLNVANGGSGVELGQRGLKMATIVTYRGSSGQAAFDAVAGLCRVMCSREARKITPVYGANDWCYSYGNSTAETILRDTEFIAEVSPVGGVRPFYVIDEGWEHGPPAWPDMAKLAAGIRQRTALPGIWVRPLRTPSEVARKLLLSDQRFGSRKERANESAYDPTIPEAREKIAAKFKQLASWGFEMIKHDFSTYDLLGQWGNEMGPQPTIPGWSFHDRTQTNAEILRSLYALIREMLGEQILINGCNTMGHLGQGIFDLHRVGDDTSGKQWERTRRMGINAAAFRLPQQGTFFTIDPDLVGITEEIPWELNRQWLDLLARSGSATMVSPGPPSYGVEQRAALRDAFHIAAQGGLGARPDDWLENSCPEQWRSSAGTKSGASRYRWSEPSGSSPFLGG